MRLIITADMEAYQKGQKSIKERTLELNGSEHWLLVKALEHYKRDPAITDEQYDEIEQALRDLNSPDIEVINLD